ncbi:hypothetical protein AB0C65_33900 [Nocardia sp. NPDC048505]|uniref:hypothetical protein n=1 Tax=Nocardia sp. NPDC048505 TaxID=3155756 RepID=UPI0033C3779B
MGIFRRKNKRRSGRGTAIDHGVGEAALAAGEALPWVFRMVGGAVRGLLNALN